MQQVYTGVWENEGVARLLGTAPCRGSWRAEREELRLPLQDLGAETPRALDFVTEKNSFDEFGRYSRRR